MVTSVHPSLKTHFRSVDYKQNNYTIVAIFVQVCPIINMYNLIGIGSNNYSLVIVLQVPSWYTVMLQTLHNFAFL